jgi:hypothetical protein
MLTTTRPDIMTGETTITFAIRGLAPGYLMENGKAVKRAEPPGPHGRKKTDPTPEEEAESLAYRLSDDVLYAPGEAYRASLLDACETGGHQVKMGRSYKPMVMFLQAAIFVAPGFECCPLVHPGTGALLTEYEIAEHRIRNATTGGSIVRCRPWVREWATQVTFVVDPSIPLDAEAVPVKLQALMTDAGRRIGVGGFRPYVTTRQKHRGRGGPYGRFVAEIVAVHGK